jgi:hypothetical protein
MYIYLECQSNIYITKMYGTMNVKYCDVLSVIFIQYKFWIILSPKCLWGAVCKCYYCLLHLQLAVCIWLSFCPVHVDNYSWRKGRNLSRDRHGSTEYYLKGGMPDVARCVMSGHSPLTLLTNEIKKIGLSSFLVPYQCSSPLWRQTDRQFAERFVYGINICLPLGSVTGGRQRALPRSAVLWFTAWCVLAWNVPTQDT